MTLSFSRHSTIAGAPFGRISPALAHAPSLAADLLQVRDEMKDGAHAVLAYLVGQKIPLTAVDTAGFGETRPVASNDTEEGRRQNRRVDVVVTGESIGRFDAAGDPAP